MKETTLDGKTPDIAEENIDKLKQLFPEVFTEGKIDFGKLQQVLGEYVEDSNERYNFTWNGKGRALRLSQTPSLGTLRPCKEESKDWDTTQNLYIEGDNLEVLKLLQKSYHSKVKLMYCDPPYNTGKDFVYKDDFHDSLENYKRITGQVDSEGNRISTNTEASGRYHTDWLNMMYPRLRLARNLLTDDGAIFISIDDNEVDNLKKICNEVFGEDNFVMQVTWRRTDNQPNIGKFARVKEYIVCYCKDALSLSFGKLPLTEKAKNEYRYEDEKGKFRRAILLDKTRGRHTYPVTTKGGNTLMGPWMIKEEDLKKLDEEGGIYWTSGGDEQPYGKIYLSESKGQIPNDFWGIEFGTNQRASLEVEALFEKRLFDFPKPVSLLKTLLSIGSEKDSIILDFFSGSSTTAHAVMQLNAEDGGNRKFIMVQLPEPTDEKDEAYKAGYMNICEIGKERIRRAGEKIKEENKDKENIANLDIGFKVLKLDTSNIRKWQPDYDNLEQSLLDYVDNYMEGRTELDVVYEIMLKYGLDLTYPVDGFTIQQKKVYSIGFGMLMICLDNEITTEVAKGILEKIKELAPETTRVVFKDNGFKTDSNKTNIKEILKSGGIEEFITI
jgi:adenine-specific DNA-methyltransferase